MHLLAAWQVLYRSDGELRARAEQVAGRARGRAMLLFVRKGRSGSFAIPTFMSGGIEGRRVNMVFLMHQRCSMPREDKKIPPARASDAQ